MKNKSNLILLAVILTIVGLIIWKHSKSEDKVSNLKNEHPFIATIEQKRVIPGNLYPLTEIEVKSTVSGTLDTIFVKVGDKVKIGDRIAQIKLVPDPSKLELAKTNYKVAEIGYENQKKIFSRYKKLYDTQVITSAEFEEYQRTFSLSKEEFQSAQNQLMIAREGYVRNADVSNVVKATASGTIIDLPIKQGTSVTERNNFNNGTTLASIAQLETFVFKGKVNESDVAYMHLGMEFTLGFNAFKDQVRKAVLNKISAKGTEEQGVMKYYIEGYLNLTNDSLLIRSGYSANAEIVLQRHGNILAIKEEYLQFQNDSTYVTLLTNSGQEKKRFVTTGLSDGINIEIKAGLKKDDILKKTGK